MLKCRIIFTTRVSCTRNKLILVVVPHLFRFLEKSLRLALGPRGATNCVFLQWCRTVPIVTLLIFHVVWYHLPTQYWTLTPGTCTVRRLPRMSMIRLGLESLFSVSRYVGKSNARHWTITGQFSASRHIKVSLVSTNSKNS